MITLVLQDEEFAFEAEATVGIGRSAGNLLRIEDGRISSLHGQLRRGSTGWLYRDLRSTNGSMVERGEERIVVDGERTIETPVRDGDRLLLGDVEDPVVLLIHIRDVAPVAGAEGTVVARRPMDRAGDLGAALFAGGAAGFQALAALLRRVGQETEPDVVFENVAGFLLDLLGGAETVVLVPDGDGPGLRVTRGARKPTEVSADPGPWPRGLVAEAVSTGSALLSTDEATVDAEQSLARFGASAALAVPLGTGTGRVGALVLTAGAGGFAPRDLDLAVALGHQVASAFHTARLVKRLRAVERRLRDENRYLKTQAQTDATFTSIIGASPAIQAVFEKMRVVMDTDATVLITGETGTGKELVARALHDESKRKRRLFAPVNCAALAETLLESELFGHVKGAFTGAHDTKKGLFQVADGGTMFLDEIGELSPKLQAKLLRVLQEGEVLPVGATRPVRVDVRIVAATHRDLKAWCRDGRFREDLYYRINVFPIAVPPLRARGEDVPVLAQFFLDRYSKRFGKEIPGLTEAAAERLSAHPFPGNIRELENEMQRAVLLTADGQPVEPAVLSDEVRGATPAPANMQAEVTAGASLKETMERIEREVLRRALEDRGWNRSATARDLRISRQALVVKLGKYNLAPD